MSKDVYKIYSIRILLKILLSTFSVLSFFCKIPEFLSSSTISLRKTIVLPNVLIVLELVFVTSLFTDMLCQFFNQLSSYKIK